MKVIRLKESRIHQIVKIVLREQQIEVVRKNYKDIDIEGDLSNFTGIAYHLYPNGQLKIEDNYKDGKRDGLQKEWYENGQLESEENNR